MRRLIFAFLALGVLLLLPFTLAAQVPATTEEPQPTIESAAPVSVATQPAATLIPPQIAPLPTALDAQVAPTAPPAPASPIDAEAIPILVNARTDLELLANQALGSPRPNGWSGSLDINNPQLPILIRLDLELLAGAVMGANQRPAGWFGPVPSSTLAIARDIRHDLELLADQLNPPNVRPAGWSGADPLMRCDRSTQALVNLLEKQGSFKLNVDVNAPDFCQQAALQVSQFVEINILSNPSAAVASGSGPATIPNTVKIKSQFAVAFLSRFGSQQVGAIPIGLDVKPIARSFTQFSKMILVSGDGFEVFMDYRDTTLTDAQFAALQDVNTVTFTPSCAAAWCQAPTG